VAPDINSDLSYWKEQADTAPNKSAALVAWGIWAGLRIAQDEIERDKLKPKKEE
jgi:hypothetical protein